jgi:microsomal dipeptidase-like Zn-dependent dipeptidase
MSDLWGYADLHCHPASHLAFGGQHVAPGTGLFWGLPGGPTVDALPCCRPLHTQLLGGYGLLPHLCDSHHGWGSPSYGDWPRHDTTLHQQMHIEWTRRAFDSGLRLICALAVNNEMLADLAVGADHDNADKASIEAQLVYIRQLVADHADWMALVLTPDEARRAIDDGKLAVLLGVEVDLLGGFCAPDQCTRLQAADLAGWLHGLGVRVVTPMHLVDNAFGGCAIASDQFAILNHYLHRRYRGDASARFYDIDGQADAQSLAGVEFLLGRDPGLRAQRNAYAYAFPDYGSLGLEGHVNAHGITDRGRELITAMMRYSLLIDVDHMSQRMRSEVLDLAERYAYPLISTHTSFRELQLARRAHDPDAMHGVANEGSLRRDEISRIAALGGLVAPITHLGPVREYAHPAQIGDVHDAGISAFATVAEQDTSHSWAHAYLYALELMGGRGVAIGTDFNGLAQQPGPRFPRGGQSVGSGRLRYGRDLIVMTQRVLERAVLGDRSYDLDEDGLAHYGMLPDFLRDIANQLPDEGLLAAFYRSADDTIGCWDKAVSAGWNVI